MSNRISQATSDKVNAQRQALKTPRAAAVAGIVFAVLFTTAISLMRLAVSDQLSAATTLADVQQNSAMLSLALTLLPFAGISFLWFVGVVRDHLGEYEDKFFSSIFFGSGLLFLAMIFVTGAVVGAVIMVYPLTVNTLGQSDVILFGRALVYSLLNVYVVRMAGVFMFSVGTIWVRTRVMPRAFVLLTYLLALVLLFGLGVSSWLLLVFPVWVFGVSVYILFKSWRGEQQQANELLGAAPDA